MNCGIPTVDYSNKRAKIFFKNAIDTEFQAAVTACEVTKKTPHVLLGVMPV